MAHSHLPAIYSAYLHAQLDEVNSLYSMEKQQGGAIPVECLETLLPSQLPPHRLTLKTGATIMPLRNISNRRSLAIGTRMIMDCQGDTQPCHMR